MVAGFSKLMLRAYSNEAEHAVHTMKPYALESTIARLDKARETISKLGATMKIRVTDSYHRLRVQELELTADHLAKVAQEKERAKEERARLREEEIARREYEREQERLRKEQAHYEATLAALKDQGDIGGQPLQTLTLTPPLSGEFSVYGGADTVARARKWALENRYLLCGGVVPCAHGLYLMGDCPGKCAEIARLDPMPLASAASLSPAAHRVAVADPHDERGGSACAAEPEQPR
jgi:Domain of unknown function (DUF4041)